MKKVLAVLMALTLVLGGMHALAEDEENYDTGDAKLDLVRNEDSIGEKELLVVSFGTSFNDSRRMTIGGIEAALAEALPERLALLPYESDARPAVVRHEGDIHLAVGHAVGSSTIVWLEGEAFLPGIEHHGTIVQP